jgi:hypothetical protein
MLVAYIDESGHSRDPRSHFAGMGALIADSADWDTFTSEWSAALSDAGIKGEFHMRLFAHCRGPFEGWTEDRRRSLFAQLVGAIVKIKAIPVGGERPLLQFYDSHDMLRIYLEATGQDRQPNAMVSGLLTESWLRKIAVREVLLSRLKNATPS